VKTDKLDILAYVICISENNIIRSEKTPTKTQLRRDFLINNTIPILKINGIDLNFFDAIMFQDLDFDRSLQHKVYDFNHSISHNNRVFLLDKEFPTGFEIALCLGHMYLWEMSVKYNKCILILEDDVMVDQQKIENIKQSFVDFDNISEPSLLYLQSTNPCTVNPKTKLKGYPNIWLQNYTDTLIKVSNNYVDWSGSAAYYLNPSGAKKLLKRVSDKGLRSSDGFIHRAILEKYIDVYIPKNYQQCFLLHPEYS
jgi:GR25 family glycosyltransferase involved in LPS biosynthesis